MNKIKVIDDKIKLYLVDDAISIEVNENIKFFSVKDMTINVNKDTNLEIEYSGNSSKMSIVFNIAENAHLKVFEINTIDEIKYQYKYNLEENSELNIIKFYDSKNIRQQEDINLNGKYANVIYKLKTISNGVQNFNLYVNHNKENTFSNICNNGVNLTGKINFDVTGIVTNKIKDCEVNQYNEIITFEDNNCTINPKLLIEENDVVANHSALIGKFDPESIFYIQSRGIDYDTAINLLVKGFLLENLDDERLNKIIEKYWR